MGSVGSYRCPPPYAGQDDYLELIEGIPPIHQLVVIQVEQFGVS